MSGKICWVENGALGIPDPATWGHPVLCLVRRRGSVVALVGTDRRNVPATKLHLYELIRPDARNNLSIETAFKYQTIRLAVQTWDFHEQSHLIGEITQEQLTDVLTQMAHIVRRGARGQQ